MPRTPLSLLVLFIVNDSQATPLASAKSLAGAYAERFRRLAEAEGHTVRIEIGELEEMDSAKLGPTAELDRRHNRVSVFFLSASQAGDARRMAMQHRNWNITVLTGTRRGVTHVVDKVAFADLPNKNLLDFIT